MKRDIAWHQNCLKHWEDSLARDRQALASLLAKIAREEEQLGFYRVQIQVALKQGRSAFDRDRFLKSRPKKDKEEE